MKRLVIIALLAACVAIVLAAAGAIVLIQEDQ